MRIRTLLFCVLLANPAHAEETIAVKLRPRLSYHDDRVTCSTAASPSQIWLDGKVSGGKVVRASLHEVTHDPIPARITLNAAELAAISVDRNSRGFWLRAFPLSERLTLWFLVNAGTPQAPCKPSDSIRTLEPREALLHFTNEVSETVSFEGRLRDGSAFRAELEFTEQ